MKKSLLILFSGILFILLSLFIKDSVKAAPIGNYLELLGGYLKTVSLETSPPAGFTFEAWIKPDKLSGTQTIISIGDRNSKKLYYEVGTSNDSLFLSYTHGIGGQTRITADQIPSSQWTHIAVTILPATTKLFIDGSPVFAPKIAISQLKPIGPDIILGNSYLESWDATQVFRGAIDEVRISQAERDVAGLWASGVYKSPLVLDQVTVILWHLDETRGEVVAQDSSGNNYHGNLIGGDSKIHFFGILPTPTPFVLPPLRWVRPVLPTLSFPAPRVSYPTSFPPPSQSSPAPTSTDLRGFPRQDRPSRR